MVLFKSLKSRLKWLYDKQNQACKILYDVFHVFRESIKQIVCLLAGIGVMYLVSLIHWAAAVFEVSKWCKAESSELAYSFRW